MTKIACIGITVQDRIYYVDHIPTTSGKFVANAYKEIGGGPAATAAVAIAKLGGEVDFIGRIGDDNIGKVLLKELESYKVNTKLLKVYENAKSSQSTILVDRQGERLILNYPSPDLLTETVWLDNIDFTQYDAILCDVRWHQGTQYCLNKARQLNIVSILDADLTSQDITPLAQLSDYTVFSEPGLKRMTGQPDLDKALKQASEICRGNVYVTQGNQGCSWIEKNKKYHCESFKVQVIDTTGAGDVFHGAFTFAVANGYSGHKVVEFASAVAALKCTAAGGRDGIPNLVQVNEFLAKY